MKQIFTIILLLIFTISLNAQKGIIRGIVTDSENESLPGVNLIILETQNGTVSDVSGAYTFINLDPGVYTIKASYIGFEIKEIQINLASGETQEFNIQLQSGILLNEVVVNGRLVGQSKSINTQKNAMNITSIVSSEELSRFPDANIGDALKRIPGINVQYDQGEARFGNIRGLSPELNSITINGERIPSAEAEIRSVQLDLVPSDMVESVEYNKVVLPSMDADAIGGSINLITKYAPVGQEFSGKIGASYNFISEKPSFKGNLTYSTRIFDNKLGIVLSASAYDNRMGSDNIEAEWAKSNNKIYPSNFQNRQYFVERFRQSYSTSVDYKINNNHTIYAKGIYNWRKDWENRYRYEFKDIEPDGNQYVSEVRRQIKFGVKDNKYARLEDQKMMNFSIGGEHLFPKFKMNWTGSYAKANEERPHERYLTYRHKNVPFNIDLSNPEQPQIIFNNSADGYLSNFSFKELTEEYQYTEDIDKNFRLNIEIPLSQGDNSAKLMLGGNYRGKEKMRENWLKDYSPVDEDAFDAMIFSNTYDASRSNYLAGDYLLGIFPKKEISDNIDLNNSSLFEVEDVESEKAGNFNATENITAAYVMLTQQLGNNLTLIGGLRFENTSLEYQGNIYNEDENTITKSSLIKDSYTNYLPSIIAKYALSNNSNLRLAWTNTLARPNYYDLVPYVEITADKEEILFGNPNLLPTTSVNFDLMYEIFFSNIGLASAGVYYKSLSDVVAYERKSDYFYQGNTYDKYRKPMNIGDANLIGFELSFSRRLDFLPSFLSKLSLYTNYTYNKSKIKNIIFEGRQNEDLPLSGSPKNIYNISLAYDTKNLDIRVSFNHSDAFLNVNDDGGFGEEAFEDIYYDAVNYLDINAEFKINKKWSVYANANNLLNTPLRTYQGSEQYTYQAEYYGIKFNAGIKFKFQ